MYEYALALSAEHYISGSKYLQTSNRQKCKRKETFSKYKMTNETSDYIANAASASENDNTESAVGCDSKGKRSSIY